MRADTARRSPPDIPDRGRVVVVAPVGRDAPLTQSVLSHAAIASAVCASVARLPSELDRGAAAVLMTEEAFVDADVTALAEWVRRQPSWSDLPLILLVDRGASESQGGGNLAFLKKHANITVLERPIHSASLISAVQASLRARARQYEVADALGALAASEQRYRTLAEALPQLVWTCLPDGRCDYLSRQWVDYTGIPEADQLGLSWADLVIHPDDRRATLARWMAAVEGRIDFDLDCRIRRADGHYCWFKIRATPIRDGDRRIARWFGTCTDIGEIVEARETLARSRTQLEALVWERTRSLAEANQRLSAEVAERLRAEEALGRSEETYRALYNRTPVPLHSVDEQGRLIRVSDYWLELFGYEREAVIGREMADFMTPFSARRLALAWPRFLATDHARAEEYQFVRKSGEIVDVLLSARIERDHAGRFSHSLTVLVDITAQKRAEDTLRQTQKLESIGQLTSGIAHDFNNLLTAVQGHIEMAQRRVTDEAVLHMLRGAARAADRGARLTTQLLAYSRKQRLAPRPVDLNRLVTEAGDMLFRTIGTTVRIDTVLEAGLWPALADPNQIELVILNLAINGRDAMPDGGRLTIRTANVPDAQRPAQMAIGDYVMISVSDTGIGMSEEILAKAFEPFFTTKEVGQGSGLGLSMVLGVATQLGGDVQVDSRVGQGTTVRVYLPRSAAAAVPAPTPEGIPTITRGSATILVVDDDPDVREIAVCYLNELGYRTVEAEDGPSALDKLALGGVDLVLSDLAMPGMNGVDFVRRARERHPRLRALFITGYTELDAFAAGDDPILPKPYQMEALAEAVRGALQGDAAQETGSANVVPLKSPGASA